MLSSKERASLRAKAHFLDPIVVIGKKGLTSGALESIRIGLESHELIKIRFIEFKDSKESIINKILSKNECLLVSIIGHVAILYKPDNNTAK